MQFQFTLHCAALSATALISAIVAFIAWERRATCIASTPFAWMMVAITGYSAVAALEAGAIALADKIFWSKLEYAGSGSVITLFLIFTLEFTHQTRWLTRKNTVLLWLIPTANFALAATNEWHQLVWLGFSIYPAQGYVVYHHGPGFFWVMAWSYLYALTAIVFIVKAMIRPTVLHRPQLWLLLLGAVAPVLSGTAYMLGATPPGLNATPLSLLLTGLACSTSLFCFRMFDLVPIARDTVFENMNDGVLVLDRQQRIVDLNLAAQSLTGLTRNCMGKGIDHSLPHWQPLLALCNHPRNLHTDISLGQPPQRHIEVRMTLLCDRSHRSTGVLLLLRDITFQYQAQFKLQQANAQLQEQLAEVQVLQSKLREQAIRDGLTGLFNRRYFEDVLQQILGQARQRGTWVAVVLIDVDYFKAVNDTFGHQGGDRVLQVLSQILQEHSRPEDIPCRYGGEEFALLLPGTPLAVAYERAEIIRHVFQHTPVVCSAGTAQATLSGGVGVFPDHGATGEDLLQEVDRALYGAKMKGRNQIQIASLSHASPLPQPR